MPANGPAVWLVGDRVRVGMRFCKVPIDGQAFGVMMKLSGLPKTVNKTGSVNEQKLPNAK
jgi:hypothetical protein